MSEKKAYKDVCRWYLGHLFTKVTKEEVSLFDNTFKRTIKSRYFRGDNVYLKKLSVYFLMSKGKILEYKYTTASEILASWLGKEDEEGISNRIHIDCSTPVLFIHNLRYYPPNKQLEMLLCQQISERSNRGLTTIFLDEEDLQEVRKVYVSYGLDVYTEPIHGSFKNNQGSKNSFNSSIL